jgi:hypothetical protein
MAIDIRKATLFWRSNYVFSRCFLFFYEGFRFFLFKAATPINFVSTSNYKNTGI